MDNLSPKPLWIVLLFLRQNENFDVFEGVPLCVSSKFLLLFFLRLLYSLPFRLSVFFHKNALYTIVYHFWCRNGIVQRFVTFLNRIFNCFSFYALESEYLLTRIIVSMTLCILCRYQNWIVYRCNDTLYIKIPVFSPFNHLISLMIFIRIVTKTVLCFFCWYQYWNLQTFVINLFIGTCTFLCFWYYARDIFPSEPLWAVLLLLCQN